MQRIARYFFFLLLLIIFISTPLALVLDPSRARSFFYGIALGSTALAILMFLYDWGLHLKGLDPLYEKDPADGLKSKKSTVIGHPGTWEKLEEEIHTLSRERDHLHTILNSMREGLVVTDAQGHILSANPSFYQLLALNHRVEGKTILEALRNKELYDTLHQSLNTQSPQEREITYYKKNQNKNLLVRITPLMEENQLEGSILVFFDLTPIRKLENARKDFVANVSHELKTPLTSIRGFAETLKGHALENPETARRFLEKIERNAAQLQNLIEDLLKLSEIESGRSEFNPQALSLRECFEEIHFDFSGALQEKQLHWVVDLPNDLPVLAEPGALKQILINLISNAIKYTPEGGTLTLKGERRGSYAKISVADTGLGIPNSDLPRIFERFYRVDKARTRQVGGTGLGLAIVKHLVQRQGGEVGVKSQLGQGSFFWFSLPLSL